jgi:hypothetical protein
MRQAPRERKQSAGASGAGGRRAVGSWPRSPARLCGRRAWALAGNCAAGFAVGLHGGAEGGAGRLRSGPDLGGLRCVLPGPSGFGASEAEHGGGGHGALTASLHTPPDPGALQARALGSTESTGVRATTRRPPGGAQGCQGGTEAAGARWEDPRWDPLFFNRRRGCAFEKRGGAGFLIHYCFLVLGSMREWQGDLEGSCFLSYKVFREILLPATVVLNLTKRAPTQFGGRGQR